MTFTFKHSAAMMAALLGATIASAAMAEKGPMGGPMMLPLLNLETMDADKDGKITKEELTAARTARFTEADADKDGKLSAAEMIAMREKAEAARKAEMASAMIGRIDTDKDGLVSAEEMAALPGPDKMFDRVDANADGAITADEIEAMKARMAERMEEDGGHHRGHGKGHGGGFWMWMGGDN